MLKKPGRSRSGSAQPGIVQPGSFSICHSIELLWDEGVLYDSKFDLEVK
jgi:hypothetical protein